MRFFKALLINIYNNICCTCCNGTLGQDTIAWLYTITEYVLIEAHALIDAHHRA